MHSHVRSAAAERCWISLVGEAIVKLGFVPFERAAMPALIGPIGRAEQLSMPRQKPLIGTCHRCAPTSFAQQGSNVQPSAQVPHSFARIGRYCDGTSLGKPAIGVPGTGPKQRRSSCGKSISLHPNHPPGQACHAIGAPRLVHEAPLCDYAGQACGLLPQACQPVLLLVFQRILRGLTQCIAQLGIVLDQLFSCAVF